MRCYIKENDDYNFELEIGWGNGYVSIPLGHKLYGKDFRDIDNKYFKDLDCKINYGDSFENFFKQPVLYESRLNHGLYLDCFGAIFESIKDSYKNHWVFGFETYNIPFNIINDQSNLDKETIIENTKKLKSWLESINYNRNELIDIILTTNLTTNNESVV